MKIEKREVTDAVGTIVMRNVADEGGRRVLKKGTILTQEQVQELGTLGQLVIEIGVLGADDAHEDEAAAAIAAALQTDQIGASSPAGGRVNLWAGVSGVLEVDSDRLIELNMLPGITLATRRQHAVVGPDQESDNIATLKIIPFAIRQRELTHALTLCAPRPGLLELRPIQAGRKVAILLVGDPPVHGNLHRAYVPPTETRIKSLGAELAAVEAVTQAQADIEQAVSRLAAAADLLIIAGQTSIMDQRDTTLRALRNVGAIATLTGAPVEPGNLLALAYLPDPDVPILCAPGCARGLRRNVVDLVLPRLLAGEILGTRQIAELGLGGFLTRAERAGDTT